MGRNVNQVIALAPSDDHWPQQLQTRLGSSAPSRLWTIGDPEILAERKTALFCSVRCPGDAILAPTIALESSVMTAVTVSAVFILSCGERMFADSASGKTADYYRSRSGFWQNPASVGLAASAGIRPFGVAVNF